MAESAKSAASSAGTTTAMGAATSNSNAIFVFRYPSLAELSAIATNCNLNITTSQATQAKSRPHNTRSATANGSWIKQEVIPATPPKADLSSSAEHRPPEDPVTPTANLKMLVSAASPAIRDREIKKRELFPGGDRAGACLPRFGSSNYTASVENTAPTGSSGERITVSRKDKSLGLLCQRFLAKYPEYPPNNQPIEISLDEVAKDLSVERRRIYDIVNVLESVEVISRHAKNRYTWHGKARLNQTLIRLKEYAEIHALNLKQATTADSDCKPSENASMKGKKNISMAGKVLPRLLPKDLNVDGSTQNLALNEMAPGQENQAPKDENNNQTRKVRDDYNRKDKSLGVLSQKFLMMFLVSETKYVTLEEAANLLIDEDEQGQAKYKTKVRRLYDIANILSSLQLIEKVHVHSIQNGRKPGFRWIGIDPDKLKMEINKEKFKAEREKSETSTTTSSELCEALNSSSASRLINRSQSQQQLLRDKANSTGKLPRSRSERVLGNKRRASLDGEDGFSLQELTASPTEQKFRAELKKLQQQYPDRMSQLLSACKEGFPADFADSRKSRRSLFLGPTSDDGPDCKRAKADVSPMEKKDTNGQFVHSSMSPFKVVLGSAAESEASDGLASGADNSSPEAKILLERQKQQQLWDEQKDFTLQDERWTRIQHELEKAFPGAQLPAIEKATPNAQFPAVPSAQLPAISSQSSVGIQASLINGVSPLKPPSYYGNARVSPWKPIHRNDVGPSPLSSLHVHLPPSSAGSSTRVTPPSGQSTPSPSPLVKPAGQTFNSPALYSPRSLTPTPTGFALPAVSATCGLVTDVVPSNCQTPATQVQPCGAGQSGETPLTTTQLLSDVSKRLSLPSS